jgi:putative membrane protein
VSTETPEGWQRLPPLSPVVRGGRATIAIFILLIPVAFGGDTLGHEIPQLGVVTVIVLAGVVSWLVTRWRIEDDDLRIETGLLRRQSLRFPLAQVQAIDVVRPGLARLFRVAELRLRMAGSSGATARLAYVAEHEVEPLRDELLALARGARVDEGSAAPSPEPAIATPKEHVLATVATGPLVASILLENWWIVVILVGLLAGFAVSPHRVAGLLGGSGFIWAATMATFVWRRFNQQYRLTVAEGPDGLHLRGGLIALTAEVIRPGRVQAVRLVEPALWRPLGWCRLEVDIAGRQRRKGEGEAQRGELHALIPVGKRSVGVELVEPPPAGPAARALAAAAPRLLEEPVPLPGAELGPERDLCRDDERAPTARHLLGAAREGAEPPPRAGTGAAPPASRERPRRHRRASRPRDTSRPRLR